MQRLDGSLIHQSLAPTTPLNFLFRSANLCKLSYWLELCDFGKRERGATMDPPTSSALVTG